MWAELLRAAKLLLGKKKKAKEFYILLKLNTAYCSRITMDNRRHFRAVLSIRLFIQQIFTEGLPCASLSRPVLAIRNVMQVTYII